MREAIVLAGGKGTRLRSVVTKVPKPMAPVAGRPFLEYILDRLIDFRFTHVILSVGYKAEQIINYFGENYLSLSISYAIEKLPLGTGGAIKMCLQKINSKSVLILNGDTYAELNYDEMFDLNLKYNSIVIGCVEVDDVYRYGALEVEQGYLRNLNEKGAFGPGIINAGCYILNKHEFLNLPKKTIFSFEKDYLQKIVNKSAINVHVSEGKFIDIGIPDDYFYAQNFFNEKH